MRHLLADSVRSRLRPLLTPAVTRSHKYTDRDHAAIADGSAERDSKLPRYFAKQGHADADPTKTKKDGSGKGNWYVRLLHPSPSSTLNPPTPTTHTHTHTSLQP